MSAAFALRRVIRFHLIRHVGLDGVRLSRAGQWGNLPFSDDGAAELFARKDAAGQPHTIERATVRRRALNGGSHA